MERPEDTQAEDRVAPYVMSAASAYAQAYRDGDLANIDPEDMYDITAVAAMRPELVAVAMGDDPTAADGTTPGHIRARMVDQYDVACLEQMLAELADEQESIPEHMVRARMDAAFSYSNVDPETAGQILFDAENGDDSALRAVKDRFYLG